jgi:copper chaperone
MIRLSVPDMSCGHCTAAIENAIMAVDPTAKVLCDLAGHAVEVDSALDENAVQSAIRAVGYNPGKPAEFR